MVYRRCLPCIFHLIVVIHRHHPHHQILIAKYNYFNAYSCMTQDPKAADQTISAIDNATLIATHLTFGGSPKPPQWCSVLEMVTDLSNKISQMEHWDPSSLFNPDQPTTPTPKLLPLNIPIALLLRCWSYLHQPKAKLTSSLTT